MEPHALLETLVKADVRDKDGKPLALAVLVILLYLYERERPICDVAAAMASSRANASDRIQRWVEAGLVERRENPENRRSKLVALAPAFEKQIREALAKANPEAATAAA